MARFRASDINLHFFVAPAHVEAFILAALDVLVPRYAKRVYFYSCAGRTHPTVAVREKRERDVKCLPESTRPSNLGASFKIIDDLEYLHIAGGSGRITKRGWVAIARALEARVDAQGSYNHTS